MDEVGSGADELVARVRASVLALRRAQDVLRAGVRALEADETALRLGYRGTARLLEDACRLDHRDATALVRHAEALGERTTLLGETLPARLPATAEAARDGVVDSGHITVIDRSMRHLRAVPGLGPDVLERAETTLADAATRLTPAGLAKAAARLLATLDPDGVAPTDDPEPTDEVMLGRGRDGAMSLRARIHAAADQELLREVFDALSGRAGPDDDRTLPERRSEALLDLAAQALASTGIASRGQAPTSSMFPPPATARTTRDPGDGPAGDDHADDHEHDAGAVLPFPGLTARPDADPDDVEGLDDVPDAELDDDELDPALLADPDAGTGTAWTPRRAPDQGHGTAPGRAWLTLTVGLDALRDAAGHGLLDSGATLSGADARRLACDAAIIPMVLGGRSEPLDVGRAAYAVPRALRRALEYRDHGCSFPGCTRRPKRCHAHHIEHWIDGGATSLENTCLLCRFHHHLVHHGGWEIHVVDGHPWFAPPGWIDPEREPRPGNGGPPFWPIAA